jgi:hypothetical protein
MGEIRRGERDRNEKREEKKQNKKQAIHTAAWTAESLRVAEYEPALTRAAHADAHEAGAALEPVDAAEPGLALPRGGARPSAAGLERSGHSPLRLRIERIPFCACGGRGERNMHGADDIHVRHHRGTTGALG